MSARIRIAAASVTAAIVVAGCGAGDRPTLEQAPVSSGPPPEVKLDATNSGAAATSTTAAPTPTVNPRPAAPNGRTAPNPARTPSALAAQLAAAERAVRNPATPAALLPDIAHTQQVAYRILSSKPEWDAEALAALPNDLRPAVEANLAARRAFFKIGSGFADSMPAWEIIPPAPAESLVGWYREAEAATGIPWTILASINFVETGFGRIRGLSTAGARGPMQFLPTTWAEPGIGRGSIDDPRDAIGAAARYLVRRGGPSDMRKALFGYNNSNAYVDGVLAYAKLMEDERAFLGYYHWEIYFGSPRGGLWLPVGVYNQPARITVDQYIASAPWSLTPQF